MADSEIVQRLQCAVFSPHLEFAPNNWGPKVAKLFEDALREIQRLEGMLGAVTDGPTFAELREAQVEVKLLRTSTEIYPPAVAKTVSRETSSG